MNSRFSENAGPPAPWANGNGGTPVAAKRSGSRDPEIRDYYRSIRRHLVLVLGLVGIATAVAAFFLFTSPPLYRARAVIQIEDARGALTGGLDAAPAIGGTQRVLGNMVDPLLSQIQILRSYGVVSQVVDELGLRLGTEDFPHSALSQIQVAPDATPDTVALVFGPESVEVRQGNQKVAVRYGEPIKLRDARFVVGERPDADGGLVIVRSADEAVDGILAGLAAMPRERTNVVDVEYTTHDPELARQVANSVVESFQQSGSQEARELSRRRREFIEGQLATTDSLISQAQVALGAFRSREQMYSSRASYEAKYGALLDLDMRREELAADRTAYASLLRTIQSAPATEGAERLRALGAAPGLAANPVVADLYGQLVRYESLLDSLTAGRRGQAVTNPDVERTNSLIVGTQSKLVAAVRSHLSSLDARLAALEGIRDRNAAELRRLPTTENEEVRLVQQVDAFRKVGDALRDELQKARIAEAVEIGQVRIVDRARRAEPLDAGRGPKLAFVFLASLLASGAGAVFLDRLNTSIHRKEDVEGVLHLPNLAVIPPINARTRTRPFRGGRGAGRGASPSNVDGAPELITHSDSRSATAEAYRTLRTNLTFTGQGSSLRSVVVTSTMIGEGKSTTATNLAVAFAQQGQRVLLVDGDLRRARLHKVFGLRKEPGLSQHLLGLTTLDDAIQQTAVENLSYLASGVLPPNPSELLGGQSMGKALRAFEDRFDMVVIDSPPLFAAADAAIIGTHADGVILVVRAGHTDGAAAAQAVEQLRTVGARVLGAVLNDPQGKVPGYGGHYHYEYRADEASV